MVTFTRGDIVRLRSDEQEAERCESESSREYHRSRRYIVVGCVSGGGSFRMPDGTPFRMDAVYEVWPANRSAMVVARRFASESDLIATGERAEEIA